MNDLNGIPEDLLGSFREREKELECLYRVEEILKRTESPAEEIYREIARILPLGWQHAEIARAEIAVGTERYYSPDFAASRWVLEADIAVRGRKAGEIRIYYLEERPEADEGPFLREEKRLLTTIAGRIGSFMLSRHLLEIAEDRLEDQEEETSGDWQVVLDLLRQTDRSLFLRISEKMLNQLSWSGVSEAEDLRTSAAPAGGGSADEAAADSNIPSRLSPFNMTDAMSARILEIASRHYTEGQILSYLRKWIQNDRLKFLVHIADRQQSLAGVIEALQQYRDMAQVGVELSPASNVSVVVSLIRRFLSTQLDYINVAKKYTRISNFFQFLDRIIYSTESYGRLGGKAAGLFLADRIIRQAAVDDPLLRGIRTPRSWYITSDMLLRFNQYNNLEEVVEQKYKDINQVRLEYPHVIQTYKGGRFPPEMVQGLSMILDDCEGRPLIIRSSSLLEDSLGAAFSGKYKSLFLANQGSKQERLDAILDAIAEVYASTFGPDPIEYRAERGLLDFSEEMGIMIQEVVGTRVGDYFLPAFAGVVFSRNEFRWSPRIRREDGLLRMVPGLGTRAVDRLSDDYPILVAPGQPGLRVNVATEEIVYYSPKKLDAINLRTNSFESLDIGDFTRACGNDLPMIERMVSVFDGHRLRKPFGLGVDAGRDDLVFTFDGLIADTDFVPMIDRIRTLLEEKLGTPVDIEFAHDGRDFYLLQCRPQSSSEDSVPAPIPKDVPEESIVFSAERYISNGRVPEITHIVYVDPDSYTDLPGRDDLLAVGRAVGKLNKLLPKRQFILMGPGRWGSRGDIKLGVSVTYSDINNTAVLIEIARRKGNYMPDLSFGTHFFQDLVEGRIRYLPLFPDDEGIVFNERFLLGAGNILPDVLPEYAHLADTIRLIDVPRETDGLVLRVLMNAELGEAVGLLARPGTGEAEIELPEADESAPVDHTWMWRLRMAEQIARRLDPERFGVEAIYVFGSTKNATAGPGSDIDLIVHVRGTGEQRTELECWLEGWSLCLDEINYLRTGYRTGGLLDVHFVTDGDIAARSSYAVKIGAVTDAARPLPMKQKD
ncbi:MAG: PEP/pyruvate-binding domain-containing protein [Candidatus Krumholzibacteria bacterium]|nr:PEP/pyruvate-binding domain-containing protein [Candidatus Krumholzibacteria bacterium]